jgi:hypothetical protein
MVQTETQQAIQLVIVLGNGGKHLPYCVSHTGSFASLAWRQDIEPGKKKQRSLNWSIRHWHADWGVAAHLSACS